MQVVAHSPALFWPVLEKADVPCHFPPGKSITFKCSKLSGRVLLSERSPEGTPVDSIGFSGSIRADWVSV